MKIKRLLPFFALFAVLLSGCTTVNVSSSKSTTKPGTLNGKSEDSEAVIEYHVTPSWPNSELAAFINEHNVRDTFPAITLEKETTHAIFESDEQPDYFCLAVDTIDEQDMIMLRNTLTAANYSIIKQTNYFYAISPLYEIHCRASFYPEDAEEVDPGLFIDIFVTKDIVPGLKEHTDWPTDEINDYLALMNSASVIPSYPNVTVCYTDYVDEENPVVNNPYLFIFIPTPNREKADDYRWVLEDDGFNLEISYAQDYSQFNYYIASKVAENLEIGFGFFPQEGNLPSGVHLYIAVYN